MPISLDYQQLDRWFDEIDRGLGTPPRNASVEIQGVNVVIVPEVDGVVVDRDRARAEVESQLLNLTPIEAKLQSRPRSPPYARPTWNRRVTCCYARCPTRFRSAMRAVSGPCRRPKSSNSCGKTWFLEKTERRPFTWVWIAKSWRPGSRSGSARRLRPNRSTRKLAGTGSVCVGRAKRRRRAPRRGEAG